MLCAWPFRRIWRFQWRFETRVTCSLGTPPMHWWCKYLSGGHSSAWMFSGQWDTLLHTICSQCRSRFFIFRLYGHMTPYHLLSIIKPLNWTVIYHWRRQSYCFGYIPIDIDQTAIISLQYWIHDKEKHSVACYDVAVHGTRKTCHSVVYWLREKGRDLTQSYDKSPYTHRKIQKATWKHKNATSKIIYSISDLIA